MEEEKRTEAGISTEERVHQKESGLQEEAPLKETRADILARHLKEKKELQTREIALKKAAAKGSKAEQKAKKKQVEEEIAKLELKMQARHTKELSDLADENNSGLDGVTIALNGGLMVGGPSQLPKPTKAQKRRDKRAQQEVEREQKIQEEQGNVVSSRMLENQQLERKLRPLGLTLKEIKPDGHCLYRAVEDQLALYPRACRQSSFQELREVAASYMRSHSEDFIPFIAAEDDGEANQGTRFEMYCREVESTASWGGQLELDAIARSLQKHIVVFSADLPEVEMGKEFEGISADGVDAGYPTLRLSYHRHAFGLGEHYNSVVPLASNGLLLNT
ncbi:hypothetical protein GOP47_0004816 [Adiantum capillus-veneris]|uniref:OTU domain-containing protein n=1 Tax=Adiantum capillus-veneris TaxID=13818 RepID=A0A9D4V4Q1_ADICA|nr:hypothetical protein GOP47_0004816 [Adiantum capillus-veneris]